MTLGGGGQSTLTEPGSTAPASSAGPGLGKNCTRFDAGGGIPLRANGFCYKDAFAEWHCKIQPIDAVKDTLDMPAPKN